jgi:hypothetical protein
MSAPLDGGAAPPPPTTFTDDQEDPMGQPRSRLARLGLSLTLGLAALGSAAASASAEPASAGYAVAARCTNGEFTAVIADWAGRGPALYVYRDGERVTAQWVTKRIVEDDENISLVGYGTARSLLDGGADLRIRTRDEDFPDTAGKAWLLYLDGGARNVLLECSVY